MINIRKLESERGNPQTFCAPVPSSPLISTACRYSALFSCAMPTADSKW